MGKIVTRVCTALFGVMALIIARVDYNMKHRKYVIIPIEK